MKNLIRIIAIAVATCAVSAYATPYLLLDDHAGHTMQIFDGSGSDSCPDAGCVTFIGSLGAWNINVDTGLTKPATGNATHLDMDLSFTAHSTGAGQLWVSFCDDGYTVTGLGVDGIGGTAAGTLVDNVLVNGNIILTQGPFGPGAFSGTTTGGVTLTPADLFCIQVGIFHSGAGSTTGDKHVTVPDGGSTVALLGLALLGLDGLRRKIRARKCA